MSEATCPWCEAFDSWDGMADPREVLSLPMAVLPSELCADCRRLRKTWLRVGVRHYLRGLQ